MIHYFERHNDAENPLVAAMKGNEAHSHRVHVPYSLAGVMVESFRSSMFMIQNGGRNEPGSPFGKLMVLTFSSECTCCFAKVCSDSSSTCPVHKRCFAAVFTMATLSAYTANLATILAIRQSATASFQDFNAVLMGGHKVCLWKGAACEWNQRNVDWPAYPSFCTGHMNVLH